MNWAGVPYERENGKTLDYWNKAISSKLVPESKETTLLKVIEMFEFNYVRVLVQLNTGLSDKVSDKLDEIRKLIESHDFAAANFAYTKLRSECLQDVLDGLKNLRDGK